MTDQNPRAHLLGSLYRLPDGRGAVRVEDLHLEDLGTRLAGRSPAPWKERWDELTPAYREMELG